MNRKSGEASGGSRKRTDITGVKVRRGWKKSLRGNKVIAKRQ